MNGGEFVDRVKLAAKRNGVAFRFDARQGKGGHGTLYYGDRKTTVIDRRHEIGPGLLGDMLRQLASQRRILADALHLSGESTQGRDGYTVRIPDVPEALTGGPTAEAARANAVDALIAALRTYIEDGRQLPLPRAPEVTGRGNFAVALPPLVAAKLGLYVAKLEAGWSNVRLARELGTTEALVRRLLDLDHRSHVESVDEALHMLGRSIIVEIEDRAAA